MYTSKLKMKTSSVNVWRSLCWWPGLSYCLVTSSISQGRTQKKPADRNCWDDSEARGMFKKFAAATDVTDWMKDSSSQMPQRKKHQQQQLTDERRCTSRESLDTSHQRPSLTTPPAPNCVQDSFLVLWRACHHRADQSKEQPTTIDWLIK